MKKTLSFVLTVLMVLSAFIYMPNFDLKADAAAYNINGGTQTSATFILDPGHGGSDPGACSLGREEAADVLDMALKVGRYIINSGYSVSFTRVTDMTQSLEAKVAQEKNGNFSYFLSIHRNAGGGTGVETFYYSGSTAGYNLAEAVNSRVASATGWRNRGLKTNSLFVVRNTSCTAALIELGFIDTAADNTTFVNYNDAIARAIAEGLLSRVGGSLNASGWQQVGGYWKYKNSNGSWATGWLNDGGTWYYLDANGYMKTGWIQLSGVWYYLADNGAMETGWIELGGVWYYLADSGAMVTGWQTIGSSKYYFNSSGAMLTGLQTIDGSKYYFNSSGNMQTGWLQLDSTWYYLADSGAMQTGWLELNSAWYYLADSGAMATGWQTISSSKYYFNTSGVMQTGIQIIDSVEYYFGSNGVMQTGWLNVNGEYQYFDSVAGKQDNWQSFSDSAVDTLNRVEAGTNTDNLAQRFAGVDWSLFGHGGEKLTGSVKIATGFVISFYDATGAVMESKAISVTGDINGDGEIGGPDCLTCASILTSTVILEEVYLTAADFDGNGMVSSSDCLNLQKTLRD